MGGLIGKQKDTGGKKGECRRKKGLQKFRKKERYLSNVDGSDGLTELKKKEEVTKALISYRPQSLAKRRHKGGGEKDPL